MILTYAYRVVWEDTTKNKREYHGSYKSYEEALQSIQDWWDKNNFKPVYVRILDYKHDGYVKIDYGNYNYFYYIEEIGLDEKDLGIE